MSGPTDALIIDMTVKLLKQTSNIVDDFIDNVEGI